MGENQHTHIDDNVSTHTRTYNFLHGFKDSKRKSPSSSYDDHDDTNDEIASNMDYIKDIVHDNNTVNVNNDTKNGTNTNNRRDCDIPHDFKKNTCGAIGSNKELPINTAKKNMEKKKRKVKKGHENDDGTLNRRHVDIHTNNEEEKGKGSEMEEEDGSAKEMGKSDRKEKERDVGGGKGRERGMEREREERGEERKEREKAPRRKRGHREYLLKGGFILESCWAVCTL